MTSSLSVPASGRSSAVSRRRLVRYRFRIVWLATCPMLSPVAIASIPRVLASCVACSSISLLITRVRYRGSTRPAARVTVGLKSTMWSFMSCWP